MKRLPAALILVALFAGHLDAQDAWDIVLASGDTLKGCQFASVSDLDAMITRQHSNFPLAVDSITSVVKYTEGSFGTGAVYGAVVGGVVGAIIGRGSHGGSDQNSVGKRLAGAGGFFVGSIAGLVVGGFISSGRQSEEVIVLSHRSHTARVMILRTLVER